ncbi:hypothetical protein EJD97_022190 [Solanum chilense]|uniref:Gag-pol polyprotein n=1 Tax=Solanum chilense TaxID=4083 RepID=A0A6N2C3U3_SOLCI|nr:hypothetical protein EJD97_022190 [Solanum chilense]
MNMRRTPARRVEENDVNEGLPPRGGHVPQVDKVPQGSKGALNDQVPIVEGLNEVLIVPQEIANREIREALLTIARAVTTQVNRDIGPRVNAMQSTMTAILRDFVRMNPLILFGSKVGEYPQAFLDEVYKIEHAMGVTSKKKVLLNGVPDIIKEECRTSMLHGDMNLSRLMVYVQSIEESKLGMRSRDDKRGITNEKVQHKFKKRASNQDGYIAPKANYERGGGSQVAKPNCVTCGKRHLGKCLAGTSGCFGFGKDYHKVRDCPTIAARGKEAKQGPPNVPDGGIPKSHHFYALRAKGTKPDDDDAVKL